MYYMYYNVMYRDVLRYYSFVFVHILCARVRFMPDDRPTIYLLGEYYKVLRARINNKKCGIIIVIAAEAVKQRIITKIK